jgi:hypothetical protein
MCISLWRSIKIEEKCSFVEIGEEFEKTKLVFKKNNQIFKAIGEVGERI